VPALAIGARRIFVGVDYHQLGMPGRVRCCRMNVEIAKEAAKGEVLVLAQVLVAEEDHRVFSERAMDFVDCAIAERLRQVDATNLASDDRRQLVDSDRVVRPGIFADILDAGTIAAAQ
jgi:hypothetical protein